MSWKGILIFISLIVLAIYMIGFGSSAPPTQQNVNVDIGLVVQYTLTDIHAINKDHIFNFHVFNISDGLIKDSSDTTCFFDLFNQHGEHIIDHRQLVFQTDHWDINVTAGNFTELGEYSYLAVCNSSAIGGFTSAPLMITQTGTELTEAKAIVFTALLFILVFLFAVNIGGITLLPSRNTRGEDGELISISSLKYLRSVLFGTAYLIVLAIMFISSNFALAYLETGLFGSVLFVIFQIMMIALLPMFVIWFVFILASIFRDIKIKGMLERGVDMR